MHRQRSVRRIHAGRTIARVLVAGSLFAVPAFTACGDGADEVDPAREPAVDTAPPEEGAPDRPERMTGSGEPPGTRAALPALFTIMAGLEEEMYRISRGLWLGAPDTVAAGAHGVAEHPAIPSHEAEAIARVLGGDMQEFARLDEEVHDLSVRIGGLARDGEIGAVLPLEAELRSRCVACHERFRDTLRASVR